MCTSVLFCQIILDKSMLNIQHLHSIKVFNLESKVFLISKSRINTFLSVTCSFFLSHLELYACLLLLHLHILLQDDFESTNQTSRPRLNLTEYIMRSEKPSQTLPSLNCFMTSTVVPARRFNAICCRWAGEPSLAEGRVFLCNGEVCSQASPPWSE